MKIEVDDGCYKSTDFNWLNETKDSDGDPVVRGVVGTSHGWVYCYASVGSGKLKPWTTLDFIIGGHIYTRRFSGKMYRPRYIATLARRFVRDVINGRCD